jgi:endoglucanase
MARGTVPGTTFDTRLLDTKTSDPEDHPWRMPYTITGSMMEWDGRWHQIRVPLSSFTEQCAWDRSWFNPTGDYDWTSVDRFEIVAEQLSLDGRTLWFDNIHISDMDTAQIYNTSAIEVVAINSNKENSL